MYADDFVGIEKSQKKILDYLLKAIEDIRPSMFYKLIQIMQKIVKLLGRK